MSEAMTSVGISDMKIIKGNGSLITYALGSCIGICIYDANTKIAGMVHIMLPNAPNNDRSTPCKYADQGIPALIQKMTALGASKNRMNAKIAGGAKMFEIMGDSAFGNIGKRNLESTKEVLKAQQIPIIGENVGGNFARTLLFSAESGEAKIKSFGLGELIL